MNRWKKLAAVMASFAVIAGAAVIAQTDIRVYVNGRRVEHDVILRNDTTYIPLRAVSEALGAEVVWDGETSSAHITFTEDDAVSEVVSEASKSVVAIIGFYDAGGSSYTNPTVHGSGVIYKNNGYILTNAHVVEDIKNLTVILNDGTSLPGEVLYSDTTADLAVVKINKIGLVPIQFADESKIESGRTAIAIGAPISLSMRNTVTKGIVSGKDVTLSDSYYKLLQTDAPINPGNSGGPLLNISGELIGINSSKFMAVGIDSMAFAIPVDTVKYAISQFESYGKINRADLGMTLENSWEARIGLPTNKGITVKASSNGVLAAGDVITKINGIAVHSVADYNEALKDTFGGSSVNVEFTRGGAVQTAAVQSKN